MLVSGLELAANKNNLSLQLFADYVNGWTCTKEEFLDAARLVHVIFAGNFDCSNFGYNSSLLILSFVVGNCIRSKPLPKPKYGTATDNTDDIEAVKELDYIIQQLIVRLTRNLQIKIPKHDLSFWNFAGMYRR